MDFLGCFVSVNFLVFHGVAVCLLVCVFSLLHGHNSVRKVLDLEMMAKAVGCVVLNFSNF